jgi:hypothetical protein
VHLRPSAVGAEPVTAGLATGESGSAPCAADRARSLRDRVRDRTLVLEGYSREAVRGRNLVPVTVRLAALVATLALAVGCGDSSAKPAAPALDVKGAPMRRDPASEPPAPPPVAAVGDVAKAAPVVAPQPEAAAPAPAPTPPTTTAGVDDAKTVTFDELAGFDYALYAEETKTKHEIPAKIQALSGKKIAVDGYMMPLAYEAGGAKKFILMKNQFGCCYGGTPKLNEWIEVTMEGGAVAEYQQHVLVTAWGVLEVKPESRDGVATSLYKMRGIRTDFTEAK